MGAANDDKTILTKNILCAVGAGVLVQGSAAAAASAQSVQAQPTPYIIVNSKYTAYRGSEAEPVLNELTEEAQAEQSNVAEAGNSAKEDAKQREIQGTQTVALERVDSFDRPAQSSGHLDDNFAGQSVESMEAKAVTQTVEPVKVIRTEMQSDNERPGIKQRIAHIMRMYEQSKHNSPYASFASEVYRQRRSMHSGIINSTEEIKNEQTDWVDDSIGENESVQLDKSRDNVSTDTVPVQQPQLSSATVQQQNAAAEREYSADIVQIPDDAPADSVREVNAGAEAPFELPPAQPDRYDFGGSTASPLYRNTGYGSTGYQPPSVSQTKPAVQNRNPWAQIDAKNKAKAAQKNRADIQPNAAVNMNSSNDTASLSRMMMIERFGRPAPLWTQEVLKRLAAEGLLAPDRADRSFFGMTRREGAVLTARSFNLYRTQHMRQTNSDMSSSGTRSRQQFAMHDVDMLMREFAPEVEALGYNIIDQVTDTKVVYKNEYGWKFGGEIRYNFMKNSGSPKYTWSDNRIRARIYADKALSPNWTLHGLLEADKSNIFDADKEAVADENNDGHLELSRIYLEGNYNWWNMPVTLELGKTYAYLAEGNVLDSDFDGFKITARPNADSVYSAGYGDVNDTENMYYFEGTVRNRSQDYLGGYYHWDNYGMPTSIYALGTNLYKGNYTLGGMYLSSNRADGSGAKDGYVLSARYGKNFPWIAHTYEFDLKYYDMAGNTYVNHTMNGLGSYMDGFKGWGAMAYYTPVENLVVGLEYYDLKDKATGEKGRTAWASLAWSF